MLCVSRVSSWYIIRTSQWERILSFRSSFRCISCTSSSTAVNDGSMPRHVQHGSGTINLDCQMSAETTMCPTRTSTANTKSCQQTGHPSGPYLCLLTSVLPQCPKQHSGSSWMHTSYHCHILLFFRRKTHLVWCMCSKESARQGAKPHNIYTCN